MSNLIRKYKIYLIDNTNVSEEDLEIILYLESKLNNLNSFIMESDIYSKRYNICYMDSNNNCILEDDEKNNILWVNSKFWMVLKYYFGLKDIDIVEDLTFFINVIFKQKRTNPLFKIDGSYYPIVKLPFHNISTPRLKSENENYDYIIKEKYKFYKDHIQRFHR